MQSTALAKPCFACSLAAFSKARLFQSTESFLWRSPKKRSAPLTGNLGCKSSAFGGFSDILYFDPSGERVEEALPISGRKAEKVLHKN